LLDRVLRRPQVSAKKRTSGTSARAASMSRFQTSPGSL